MTFRDFAPFNNLLIVSSLICVWLAVRWWQLRDEQPLLGTGALFLVCSALWIAGSAVEYASPGLTEKITWSKLQYIGIVPLPVLWVVLVMQFVGNNALLTRRNLLLLGIVPVLTVILALSNDLHHLILVDLRFIVKGSENVFWYDNGPLLWFFVLWALVIVIWPAYSLLSAIIRSGRVYRWRGLAMIVGCILVAAASAIELSMDPSDLPISPSALALIGAVPLFFVSLRALQHADIVPVAVGRVIDNMTDCMIILDPESRVIDINPAAMRLINCSKKEALGQNLGQLWPVWKRGMVTLSETSVHNEIRLCRDNHSQVFDIRASDVKNWQGNLISRVIVLRDITDRVLAEEALRSSEMQFRALTENSSDITLIVRADGSILYASPSLGRALGCNSGALIGTVLVDLAHPDDKPRLFTALASITEKSGPPKSITARFRNQDGLWLNWECIFNNSLDYPGISGIVINARDVSERVAAEEKVIESLREKEVLLKEIHHRVKNNLQVISSLLNLQSTKLQDPALRAEFQDSQDRIRSMALIHEQLYRSEDLTCIDFGSYLRDLTGSLIQSYQRQGQSISVNVGADLVSLNIDTAIPCGLIVNELVSNAFKHAFPDGRAGTVTVELRRGSDGLVKLIVQDDGVGFPPDLDYRKTSSLGLRLVNSLSRQLGTPIALSSTPGTRFEITLLVKGRREV